MSTKPAIFLKQTDRTFRSFNQGHPRSLILVPIESTYGLLISPS